MLCPAAGPRVIISKCVAQVYEHTALTPAACTPAILTLTFTESALDTESPPGSTHFELGTNLSPEYYKFETNAEVTKVPAEHWGGDRACVTSLP